MTDRLAAMNAFVLVCDSNGFAPAARRIGISPSVVTRLVAGLEARLGVRLLQRTTRSLRVTEPGARFLDRARRILADLEDAEHAAQGDRAAPTGRLVVSAPLLFGRIHVAPIVAILLAQHPALHISLELSDRFANLVEDGIDVAIRIGTLAGSTLVARRLGHTRRILVASPAYLAAHGTPTHPSDLARHRIIAFRPLSPARDWRFHDPASQTPFATPIDPVFQTNSGDAALDAATAGGGITAAYSYQVHTPRSTGALVQVLANYAPPPVPIQAVSPTARLPSAKLRAFLAAAQAAARTWEFQEKPGSPTPS